MCGGIRSPTQGASKNLWGHVHKEYIKCKTKGRLAVEVSEPLALRISTSTQSPPVKPYVLPVPYDLLERTLGCMPALCRGELEVTNWGSSVIQNAAGQVAKESPSPHANEQ
eukprot:scaffold372027_cov15-Prasinocladus_malaysianus.AAC.2